MNTINELPRFIGCEEYQPFFFSCEATDTLGRYQAEGDMPAGGAKLIMLFVNKNNAPCSIDQAAFVEIQELDANGSLAHVEHGKADKYDKWTR